MGEKDFNKIVTNIVCYSNGESAKQQRAKGNGDDMDVDNSEGGTGDILTLSSVSLPLPLSSDRTRPPTDITFEMNASPRMPRHECASLK